MPELISINEAAAQGIERVRMLHWAMPADHLKIDIINGKAGPWTHFYSESNQEINGRNPVDVLAHNMDYDAKEYVPYLAPSC